jgi:hypothetical protein
MDRWQLKNLIDFILVSILTACFIGTFVIAYLHPETLK